MKKNSEFYVYRNPDLDCYDHPVVIVGHHPVKEWPVKSILGHYISGERKYITQISVKDAKKLLGLTPIAGKVYCIKMSIRTEKMPRRYLYSKLVDETGEEI